MENYALNTPFQIEELYVTPLQISVWKMPLHIPAHRHAVNSYELHYIISGTGTVKVHERVYELSAGSVYMTGPNLVHSQTTSPGSVECYLHMICALKTPISVFAPFVNTVFWISKPVCQVSRILDALLREVASTEPDARIACETIMRQLILSLSRLYRADGSVITVAQSHTVRPYAQAKYPELDDAFAYNFKSLTLGDIADILHMSERQAQRFLKTYYGKTFSELRMNARMESAVQLLINTNDSISAISDRLGFSTIEHFSNAFRRHYGIAPSFYRKNVR